VLANRLRVLTDNELLVRHGLYQAHPVRAEYLVTPRGRAFWPVLFVDLGVGNDGGVPNHVRRLPEIASHVCADNDFAPTLSCRSCGEAVTEKEGSGARWGPSGSWPRSVPEAVTRRRSTADGKRGQAGLFPENDERVRKPLGSCPVGVRLPRNHSLHRFFRPSSERRRRC